MHINDAYKYLSSDELFDTLFPVNIQQLSEQHWTPLEVARTAAQFLAPDAEAKVIDIGAGAGKFCIAGCYFSAATFTGIEQRKNFVQAGNKVAVQLGLKKMTLVHGNFMDIDISAYTGIYFYNSFHENIVPADSLDEKVERSEELFDLYTEALHNKLKEMPIGTRLATYWLSMSEVPTGYKLHESHFNNLLKLWIKIA